MKILIILKEFKKPCAKFLRVWAENQWGLKFVEKILKFTYKNLNGKIDFLSIFYPIFPDLSHFIQLSKITPFFYNKFLCFGGGGASPLPLRSPLPDRMDERAV